MEVAKKVDNLELIDREGIVGKLKKVKKDKISFILNCLEN